MTGEATDLVALKRLAEEATPGSWEPVSLSGYGSPFSIRMAYQSDNPNASKTHYGIQSVRTRGDAHFIAAANPATILSLATLIEAQAAEIEGLRKAVEPFAKAGQLFDTGDYAMYDASIYRPAAGDDFSLHSGHLLAARRAFLASRTESAAIETTHAGSTLSAVERTSPRFR